MAGWSRDGLERRLKSASFSSGSFISLRPAAIVSSRTAPSSRTGYTYRRLSTVTSWLDSSVFFLLHPSPRGYPPFSFPCFTCSLLRVSSFHRPRSVTKVVVALSDTLSRLSIRRSLCCSTDDFLPELSSPPLPPYPALPESRWNRQMEYWQFSSGSACSTDPIPRRCPTN